MNTKPVYLDNFDNSEEDIRVQYRELLYAMYDELVVAKAKEALEKEKANTKEATDTQVITDNEYDDAMELEHYKTHLACNAAREEKFKATRYVRKPTLFHCQNLPKLKRRVSHISAVSLSVLPVAAIKGK